MPIIKSLSEPNRMSLYDVVQENFEYTGRKTFVHRCILIGRHSLGLSEDWGIGEAFQTVVTEINEQYNSEELTGVLLCYSQYFCHIAEGSEEIVLKCTNLIMQKYGNELTCVKFIAPFHHIYKRLIPVWVYVTGNPPKLIRKIDRNSDMKETYEHALFCVKKLYKLCIFVRTRLEEDSTHADAVDYSSSMDYFERSKSRTSEISFVASQMDTVGTSSDTKGKITRDYLPEYGLLEFLLESPYIPDVREKLSGLLSVSPLASSEELTWPPQRELCPKKDIIFEDPEAVVVELPKHQQQYETMK